jgi:hypothetical protein
MHKNLSLSSVSLLRVTYYPETTFVVIGAVFTFTVHTATKVWTSESICSGGYQLGLRIWIALATTTICAMIVPRVRTRALQTFKSM